MPKTKIRVVDAYVFRQTKNGFRFLLLKRARTKMYEHLWQGVAGEIEKGEKAWQTAIRELKEETGFDPIRIFVADHVSRFYETHGDRVNLVPVFGIEVENGDVTLSKEHCEFQWVDFETARNTLVWNGQKEGIAAVFDMLNSNDDRIKWSEVKI
ncbi:MAG TPA: NUDIX domain-containing protein [Candidatus Marinimicrobia bacterium]|nr:NUDIX domain-containing protein [Candidatus Neomarinimicrobiota bacterium]